MKLNDFYKVDERKRSPELDFGVWWRKGTNYPTYRVSWVENTGEVYAVNLQNDDVDILGKVEGRDQVEAALEGWPEYCGPLFGFDWLKGRLNG